MTPALGSNVSSVVKFNVSATPENTGPAVSASGVDSSMLMLSKCMVALTALPLTVPNPKIIPPFSPLPSTSNTWSFWTVNL